jgi:hypothetical protein
MKSILRPSIILLPVIVLILGVVWRMAAAQDKTAAPASGARYTVVATDGSHVIVTDNGTNRLYFYAIDREGKIGDVLKLRGSVDLNQVGKPILKPIDPKPQKK